MAQVMIAVLANGCLVEVLTVSRDRELNGSNSALYILEMCDDHEQQYRQAVFFTGRETTPYPLIFQLQRVTRQDSKKYE